MRIRLFHLVERALRNESSQTARLAGFRARLAAGGTALCQIAQLALFDQYRDIPGIRGDHVGAGTNRVAGGRFKIGGRDHRAISVAPCLGQRIHGPMTLALPCHGADGGVIVADGVPVLRQGSLGVPHAVLHSGVGIALRVAIRRVCCDVEGCGLHQCRNLRRHVQRVEIRGVGYDLQCGMPGQHVAERPVETGVVAIECDGGIVVLAVRSRGRGIGRGLAVSGIRDDGIIHHCRQRFIRHLPMAARQWSHHGDLHGRRLGGSQPRRGSRQKAAQFHVLIVMRIDRQQWFGTPCHDAGQRRIVRLGIDGHRGALTGGKGRHRNGAKLIRRGDHILRLRPLLHIGAGRKRVIGIDVQRQPAGLPLLAVGIGDRDLEMVAGRIRDDGRRLG